MPHTPEFTIFIASARYISKLKHIIFKNQLIIDQSWLLMFIMSKSEITDIWIETLLSKIRYATYHRRIMYIYTPASVARIKTNLERSLRTSSIRNAKKLKNKLS